MYHGILPAGITKNLQTAAFRRYGFVSVNPDFAFIHFANMPFYRTTLANLS
jgi:hypothetical protein